MAYKEPAAFGFELAWCDLPLAVQLACLHASHSPRLLVPCPADLNRSFDNSMAQTNICKTASRKVQLDFFYRHFACWSLALCTLLPCLTPVLHWQAKAVTPSLSLFLFSTYAAGVGLDEFKQLANPLVSSEGPSGPGLASSSTYLGGSLNLVANASPLAYVGLGFEVGGGYVCLIVSAL